MPGPSRKYIREDLRKYDDTIRDQIRDQVRGQIREEIREKMKAGNALYRKGGTRKRRGGRKRKTSRRMW